MYNMDYKEIEELIKTIDNSGLTYLEIESNGTKITMRKGTSNEESTSVVQNAQIQENKIERVVTTQTHDDDKKVIDKPSVDDENIRVVTSPIVGTFYESSGPDSEAFAKVGTQVKKGQTLCIIEAMKLMNEIESEFDGEVVEVLVKNEEMVEYGQELFKIALK
ncbi:biotin carboxyl carrier protein of acetyl-CoA carboxylase [Clostridium acetobutylicum]|nr:biotin carboxyl carrier protein of acetyl-CoA carboxylase [Clostridium acetobutylicum]OOM06833.1 biotin carboxyl carrier protein of acetyl-CoA carboxylase [Clostridium acetobutylicum]